MTRDDSFSITPPRKEQSKSKQAFADLERETSGALPSRASPTNLRRNKAQTYGQRATPPAPKEPTKRLTIDMPESLHKRVRIGSLHDGISVAELVRDYLDRKYPDNI